MKERGDGNQSIIFDGPRAGKCLESSEERNEHREKGVKVVAGF